MAKLVSRREFLRAGALTAAGLLAAACAAQPAVQQAAPMATSEPAEPAATAVPPAEEVTLEFVNNWAEYDNAFRQLLDIFEAENPGTKVNVTVVNEDTCAAYQTKVAGGFIPSMEYSGCVAGVIVNQDNYQEWTDLSEIDFPWFDRWTYDVENEWSNRYQLPGPRTLDPFQGIIASFIYHKDIMDEIGVDPQREVKTMDDFERFMADVNAFVEQDSTLEFSWDRGWINGFTYLRYMNMVPVAYADGQREQQFDTWMGKTKFNAEDSPYRHSFEFSKTALEKGWNPDGWWNREWEADQEATFSAKKSVMVLHGPWMWDKALANDPSLELLGFPFPVADSSVEEQTLHMEAPLVDRGWGIRAGNEKLDTWDSTVKLFAWWNSPDITKARAEIRGQGLVYALDESLELDAPQFQGLVKLVGQEPFANVKLDSGPWGRDAANPYRKAGEPGVWDLGGGSYNDTFIAAITGELPIQDALDIAQENWDKSFEGLPLE